jgi:hypothetical protein
MCNCSSIPANICNQCAQGNTCGCPPDYTVMPLPVVCGCCPPGFSNYQGPTPNYPDGYCTATVGSSFRAISAIPCPSCADSISADCVVLPAIPCLGLAAGTTVTQLANYLCSELFIQTLLVKIGLTPSLGSEFCQLVGNCPPVVGSTVPIVGTINVHFP